MTAINLPNKRKKKKTQIRLMDAVQFDLKVVGLIEKDEMHPERWKKWSVVATPEREKPKEKRFLLIKNLFLKHKIAKRSTPFIIATLLFRSLKRFS